MTKNCMESVVSIGCVVMSFLLILLNLMTGKGITATIFIMGCIVMLTVSVINMTKDEIRRKQFMIETILYEVVGFTFAIATIFFYSIQMKSNFLKVIGSVWWIFVFGIAAVIGYFISVYPFWEFQQAKKTHGKFSFISAILSVIILITLVSLGRYLIGHFVLKNIGLIGENYSGLLPIINIIKGGY